MVATIITPAEQVANVQHALVRAVKGLDYYGLTMRQAKKIVDDTRIHRHGTRWSKHLQRYNAAWTAVATLEHWREIKAKFEAGALQPLEVSETPF